MAELDWMATLLLDHQSLGLELEMLKTSHSLSRMSLLKTTLSR